MSVCTVGKSLGVSVDKDSVSKKLEAEAAPPVMPAPCGDVLSSSYFDVAVMRNLFSRQWQEDGYYWALRYPSCSVVIVMAFERNFFPKSH